MMRSFQRINISTHSLTRRLTASAISIASSVVYFNSQPHKEADRQGGGKLHTSHISTHSLTRRLTRLIIIVIYFFFISTHSLTRRLTNCPTLQFASVCISTHSLTRRLTCSSGSACPHVGHFNSQPHKEAD